MTNFSNGNIGCHSTFQTTRRQCGTSVRWKCKKWIQHNTYFVDYNFCSIVKIVLENNDFNLDSIFARRFWRYNYCEKSFWFFSSPLHYKKWASSHCKIFPIYILSSRKSCLFSQKQHMIWPKMLQNQVLFYT